MGTKGASGGGGNDHPKAYCSMAVSGLGCSDGPRWTYTVDNNSLTLFKAYSFSNYLSSKLELSGVSRV